MDTALIKHLCSSIRDISLKICSNPRVIVLPDSLDGFVGMKLDVCNDPQYDELIAAWIRLFSAVSKEGSFIDVDRLGEDLSRCKSVISVAYENPRALPNAIASINTAFEHHLASQEVVGKGKGIGVHPWIPAYLNAFCILEDAGHMRVKRGDHRECKLMEFLSLGRVTYKPLIWDPSTPEILPQITSETTQVISDHFPTYLVLREVEIISRIISPTPNKKDFVLITWIQDQGDLVPGWRVFAHFESKSGGLQLLKGMKQLNEFSQILCFQDSVSLSADSIKVVGDLSPEVPIPNLGPKQTFLFQNVKAFFGGVKKVVTTQEPDLGTLAMMKYIDADVVHRLGGSLALYFWPTLAGLMKKDHQNEKPRYGKSLSGMSLEDLQQVFSFLEDYSKVRWKGLVPVCLLEEDLKAVLDQCLKMAGEDAGAVFSKAVPSLHKRRLLSQDVEIWAFPPDPDDVPFDLSTW